MPLPPDLNGTPERRVMRQLAEALVYEGLVDCAVSWRGGKCRFEWRHEGAGIRCQGFIGAFGRVRFDAGTLEYGHAGRWRPATLTDVIASAGGCPEKRAALSFELDRTLDFCRWNAENLPPRPRRSLPFARLDSAMDEGHPYHPCFKARTGFDHGDHAAYGPEAGNAFQLVWLAIAPERLHSAFPVDEQAFWTWELGAESFAVLDERRAGLDDHAKRFGLMPLHPWQWIALRETELSGWLADGSAGFLGEAGDFYTASQSVRTLFNRDHPRRANLKLPMNLVNSSARRILEPYSVCSAPAISRWLKDLVAGDPLFAERYPLTILGEYAGTIADRDGPLAGQVAAIWREDVTAFLEPGETAVPLNALMMLEEDGRPFIADWIDRHGLDAWVGKMVDTVVMPLWHLLAGHGVATECHGQNLILIHRDGWPLRLAMRDFHDSVEYVPGFLRDPGMVPDFVALNPNYRDAAPNEYYWMESPKLLGELFLDCLFVYNLAEISHLLRSSYGLDEASFWLDVGRRMQAHSLEFGLTHRQAALGLFEPRIRTESLLRRKLSPPGAECAHEIPNSLAGA
ncbi:IucA/IucC family protein [Mesorhizobium yinganensis]|uniref:IucA/IucC family protein n=1 Tax=Mesorhizobium yinganensis TaxID=3157707 RepID=UPI0032B78D70